LVVPLPVFRLRITGIPLLGCIDVVLILKLSRGLSGTFVIDKVVFAVKAILRQGRRSGGGALLRGGGGGGTVGFRGTGRVRGGGRGRGDIVFLL